MRVNTPVTQVEVEFSDCANILSTTNLKGAITYINDDFIKVSGFDKEELIGKSHNIVRHPDMPPAAFAMMWSNLKSGKSWMGMVKNRCKNGNHYWVDAFATPVEENGTIREYQSVRRKPKKEYVRRAEAIYPQLKLGKTPPELKQPKLSFQLKLLSASLVPFILFSLIALTLKNPIYQAIILLTGIRVAAFSLKASMKPLSILFTRAKFLIKDPVAQYVYTERNDEIGQALLALKALESETAALIGRVAESANTMGAQSASLRESVELSTVHAGKQFTETDQVAAAINEMTSSIQEVSKSAQRSSEAANSGLEESEKGKKVVDTTVGLLEVLMQEMNTAASTIKKLENSSNSIAVVLNVINDIAEQTNGFYPVSTDGLKTVENFYIASCHSSSHARIMESLNIVK